MQFLRSSARFLWRVFRRSIAAIVLLLFRTVEFYSNIIAPKLPTEWRAGLDPYIARAENWDLYLAGLIFLFAILYTFYEVDREVTRDPKIVRKLKKLYGQSGEMLSRNVTNANEHVQLEKDAQEFYQTARGWISENMEEASLRRFEDTRMRLPYRHASPRDDNHQILLNGISIYHENIQALIDSDAWR